jgi:tripartite-type tricarboxylate transporter receptor subunit TctC
MRVLLLLALLAAGGGFAQEWPLKPVRMVVPYAAGGLPDTMTRTLAQRLAETLGQQIVVDNRPGAGGISGSELVAKSAPDGYTLLVADVGQVAINPHLYPRLPYDPLKDFAAVSLVGTSSLFLVVHGSIPAASFAELVALAKARPGALNYGSSGNGSIHHLATEVLKASLGLDIVHVPYKGTGQAVPALLGGQVKAGKLRLLAVSTAKRSPEAPAVPAIAELGVPGYDFAPEIGIVAPAATPEAIVQKLSAEIARAARHPDTVQRFVPLGIEPVGSTQEYYAAAIRAAYEKYGRAVKISGARVE